MFILGIEYISRNISDVLNITDALRAHGIAVHFVEQAATSTDPKFSTLLEAYGMVQESFLEGFRWKARQGLAKKVTTASALAGHCFGYRPSATGTVIVESEANVVRNFYERFMSSDHEARSATES